MRRVGKRNKMEPIISLINIVFLILIFFMVTGTLSRHDDGGLKFVQTTGLECCSDADALSISREGKLSHKGTELSSVVAYIDTLEGESRSVKLLPDQGLPAHQLLKIVKHFQALGVDQLLILTENSPK